MNPRVSASILGVLSGVFVFSVPVFATEEGPGEAPGAALLARAEERIREDREALRQLIGHYGLVFDVTQQELGRFMVQILLRRDGVDIVPGSPSGVEGHGGGILGLLANHWRPQARPARMDDRFPFSWSQSPVALGEIYRSHRRQVFLPVPGRTTDEIDGRIPNSPQLPRLQFRFATSTGSTHTEEVDSYHFLATLLAQERDWTKTWTNRVGQRLSADLLLQNVWDHYLAGHSAEAAFRDHSYLHLVKLFLEFSHRRAHLDPNEIRKNFLAVELRRTEFGGLDASEALGHYAESLGALLGDPRIVWSAADEQQVGDWLRTLETNGFREIADVPIHHLAHLVRGLRAIQQNR